ncbi:hypothetical protein R2F25_08980 [Streptomyces sp. UP1A-1]|nr:hypothetical protein [Streptomyces sp. UP1A-1]
MGATVPSGGKTAAPKRSRPPGGVQRGRGSGLIGIDRVLLRSVPLATGWNGLLGWPP